MLKHRINEALETLLSELYDERGINGGDISPLMSLEWDASIDDLNDLFTRLIEWNTEED